MEIRAEWGERGCGEELQSVMSVDVDRYCRRGNKGGVG